MPKRRSSVPAWKAWSHVTRVPPSRRVVRASSTKSTQPASLSAPGGSFALAQQDYPSKPLTYIVPFPPGGVTDNGARAIAKVLSEKIGQPVIVDNKPGAGGIVGSEFVETRRPGGAPRRQTTVKPSEP